MKKTLTGFLLLIIPFLAFAGGNMHRHDDPYRKTFISAASTKLNENYQRHLRQQLAWQSFSNEYGKWWVQFNECSAMPHRAFGPAIALNVQGRPEQAASYFLQQYLTAYVPAHIDLRYVSAPAYTKYIQPNFKQYYRNLEVLWSRATVKMTPDYRVVMFGLDIYQDIDLSVTPKIDAPEAGKLAARDIQETIEQITVNPDLKILPVPSYRKHDYHLVYAAEVSTRDAEGIPSRYYTLVDAHTGELLYRVNRINHFGNTDVNIKGTGYATHPYNASSALPMPYASVTINGNTTNADANGFLALPNTSSVNATITMSGPYAIVFTGVSGNTAPTFNTVLNPGVNNVSFDVAVNEKYASAYYHTNVVHDFLKLKIPTYTGLDTPLQVRVERTDGTCNAFYDGGLNFYTTAGGCNALGMVSDVVYHEYGHGITNTFWAANGFSFDNGGMGEGYSDVWAMSITSNPILGIGFSSTNPAEFVREYDFPNGSQRKVYPANLTGEVHDNGEIIAGAWWSTGLLMGSVSSMSDLFAASHFGLANGPDGSEGQVYTDILIDALEADDNDANLNNGTPNVAAITGGFAQHGITLLSNADLNHTPVPSALGNTSIQVDATLSNLQFAWALQGVKVNYRMQGTTTWNTIPLANTSGLNYTGFIPGVPNGSIIEYYIYLEDSYNNKTNIEPAGAELSSNANIPYYILVGCDRIFLDDFDTNTGNWSDQLPGDNATTGIFMQDMPELTLVGSATVQPDYQHTPGGFFCYVTGSSNNGTPSQAGANDVDGGKTSAQSPVYDLTPYSNPIFEYYRWYSNDQGATPGTDSWQVYISNNGSTWVPVENTEVADHSWRRFVFRVSDYVVPNATVSLRFVAEDANAGSLIEALFDDVALYDQQLVGVSENAELISAAVSPNPARDLSNINIVAAKAGVYTIRLLNAQGQLLQTMDRTLAQGMHSIPMLTAALTNGLYFIQIQNEVNTKVLRLQVQH